MTAFCTSGTYGVSEDGELAGDLGALAVKSLSVQRARQPRAGCARSNAGMLNSVGLNRAPALPPGRPTYLPALEASGARASSSASGAASCRTRPRRCSCGGGRCYLGGCMHRGGGGQRQLPQRGGLSRTFAHSAEATARVMTATTPAAYRGGRSPAPTCPTWWRSHGGPRRRGRLADPGSIRCSAWLDIDSGSDPPGVGGVGCPARPSTRSRCGPCGAPGRVPDVPIVGVGG